MRPKTKHEAELQWWLREVADVLLPWYRGKLPEAWGRKLPADKVTDCYTEWENAVATMAAAQADYYSGHLRLPADRQLGRLLDVGSGPLLPARHLTCTELWCADPLLLTYKNAGLLVDCGAVLLPFAAENLWTVPSRWFDTVVAVNALDHVGNFVAVAAEIERVLKPDGLIRLSVNYHPPTDSEPIQLSDEIVKAAFREHSLRRLSAAETQAVWSSQ